MLKLSTEMARTYACYFAQLIPAGQGEGDGLFFT